jgi:hypothetical protein
MHAKLTAAELEDGVLTERHGVLSVCMALAALCFGSGTRAPGKVELTWTDATFRRLVLLLLSECVSRAARVYLRFKSSDAGDGKAVGQEVVSEQSISRRLVQQVLVLNKEALARTPDAQSADRYKVSRHVECLTPISDGHKNIFLSDVFHVDVQSGMKASSRFFSTRLITNCSVQGLVATLLFHFLPFEATREGGADEAQTMREAILAGDLSMRSFLQLLLHGRLGQRDVGRDATATSTCHAGDLQGLRHRLQVALYLQGIVYHNAALRSGGCSDLAHALLGEDPQVFLNKVACEEFAIQRRELEVEQAMQAAKNAREMSKMQREAAMVLKQEAFLRSDHRDFTKVFTQEEVDKLNKCRPLDDQLQLSTSGLLLHHCACPSCPQYLQDLRTSRDRLAGGSRRHGLWKHLAIYYQPTSHRYELKGFHRVLQLRTVEPFLRGLGMCAQKLFQGGKVAEGEAVKAQESFVQEFLELYEAALQPLRLKPYDRENTIKCVEHHFRVQLEALSHS